MRRVERKCEGKQPGGMERSGLESSSRSLQLGRASHQPRETLCHEKMQALAEET